VPSVLERTVFVAIVVCGCSFAVADAMLMNRRPKELSRAAIGVAPVRWYRERMFPESARWLARLARRAFFAMIMCFILYVIVRATGS